MGSRLIYVAMAVISTPLISRAQFQTFFNQILSATRMCRRPTPLRLLGLRDMRVLRSDPTTPDQISVHHIRSAAGVEISSAQIRQQIRSGWQSDQPDSRRRPDEITGKVHIRSKIREHASVQITSRQTPSL